MSPNFTYLPLNLLIETIGTIIVFSINAFGSIEQIPTTDPFVITYKTKDFL